MNANIRFNRLLFRFSLFYFLIIFSVSCSERQQDDTLIQKKVIKSNTSWKQTDNSGVSTLESWRGQAETVINDKKTTISGEKDTSSYKLDVSSEYDNSLNRHEDGRLKPYEP